MTNITLPFSGGCACGAIRYEVTAEPMIQLDCHCRDCQHATGGAHSSYVNVPTEALKLTKGELKYYLTPSEAGGMNHRGFCAECGSPVLSKPDAAPQIVAIHAATLDDASVYMSSMDVWTIDAQPWAKMDQALPKFEKYPIF